MKNFKLLHQTNSYTYNNQFYHQSKTLKSFQSNSLQNSFNLQIFYTSHIFKNDNTKNQFFAVFYIFILFLIIVLRQISFSQNLLLILFLLVHLHLKSYLILIILYSSLILIIFQSKNFMMRRQSFLKKILLFCFFIVL